jgi:hypothetical protein
MIALTVGPPYDGINVSGRVGSDDSLPQRTVGAADTIIGVGGFGDSKGYTLAV